MTDQVSGYEAITSDELVSARLQDGLRAIRIPKVPENYSFIKLLGSGVFGEVSLAKKVRNSDNDNNITKRKPKSLRHRAVDCYAIKKVAVTDDYDGTVSPHLLHEIGILTRLRHANIVKLYDVVLSRDCCYLVFEYMQTDLAWFVTGECTFQLRSEG